MFTSVKENRIYQNIVDQILEAVHRGDLKPKDKLPSENELAEMFGVSRVTVREAIRSLEQSGIVEVRQGSLGGAYIKEVDLDSIINQVENALRMTNLDIHQLAEARATLEEIVFTKLIPAKINERDIEALESNFAAAESYFKENRQRERLSCNLRFHTMITEIAGNPIMILMHKLIINLLFDFYESVKPSVKMVKKTFEDHKRVIEYLRQRKFEEASEICSCHIEEVTARIAEKSKKQSLLGKRRN